MGEDRLTAENAVMRHMLIDLMGGGMCEHCRVGAVCAWHEPQRKRCVESVVSARIAEWTRAAEKEEQNHDR